MPVREDNGEPDRIAVREAVWPTLRGTEPSSGALRVLLFVVVRALAAAGVAGLLLHWDRHVLAVLVAVLGTLPLVLALLAPTAFSRLRRCEATLVRRLSTALAILLFAPVVYLVLAPARVLFRSGQRDRLGRRPDGSVRTYWRPHRPRRLDRPY